MFNLSKLGERLIEAMAFVNISSIQLAEYIGVSVQTVNRWKRGEKAMLLSNLIKVADALKSTTDYLIGRDDSILDFEPKKCPDFYKRLRVVMEEKNISWYKITNETSIKDSYLYLWKKGSDIKIPALITLADYFECSVDYLIGRNS